MYFQEAEALLPKMSFPEIKFGLCERCGQGGRDAATAEQLSGYELKEYEGEWLCIVCINEFDDRKQDELNLEQQREDDRFKQSIGMI